MESSISKPPGALLTTKAQLWYVDEIREQLSQSNFSVIQTSCFSHFFEVGLLKFQVELLNLLCRRLHSRSLVKNTLQFNFADHIVEFGPADFCLMSGLNFSGCPTLPKFSRFHGQVFASQENLVFADIENAFRKECAISGGQSVRSLKLAYLLIVYGLLLMNDHSTGRIELGYMHLLDDTDKFNDYPWGRVAYEYLVKSTHRLKTQLCTIENENSQTSCEAYGFVYALQCWVYEVIPALGTFCASLNPDQLTTFPRILRWSFIENSKSVEDMLWKFFLPKNGSDPVRLVLSTSEREKLLARGINSSMNVASPGPFIDVDSAKFVGRRLDFDCVDRNAGQAKKRTYKRKSSSLRESPNLSINSQVNDELHPPILRAARQTKGVSKRKIDDTPPSASFSDINNVTPDNGISHGAANLNELKSLVASMNGQLQCLQELVVLKFNIFEAMFQNFSKGTLCQCGGIVQNSEDAPLQNKRGLTSPTNAECCNEDIKVACGQVTVDSPKADVILAGCNSAYRWRHNHYERMATLRLYDPNENDFQSSELLPYISWLDLCSKSTGDGLLYLPTEIFKYADRQWLNDLWRSDGWLDSTHIDALMNLLIIRYDKDLRIPKPRTWTCMEMCCWHALRQAKTCDVSPVLKAYVRGERPLRGGVNWATATNVFGVANINNNHWVMFDISLADQLITVYNSLVQSWDCIVAHFENVRRNIATICAIGGVWDRCVVKRPPLKKIWDIVEYRYPPRQVNFNDCGVMAIKFMECLAFKLPVSEIDPKKCEDSRQRYCAKLFKLSGELKRAESIADEKI